MELQSSANSSSQNENFVNTSKILIKKRIFFHMKSKVCLKHFVYDQRYQVLFWSWRIGPLLKPCKVSTYYTQDFIDISF